MFLLLWIDTDHIIWFDTGRYSWSFVLFNSCWNAWNDFLKSPFWILLCFKNNSLHKIIFRVIYHFSNKPIEFNWFQKTDQLSKPLTVLYSSISPLQFCSIALKFVCVHVLLTILVILVLHPRFHNWPSNWVPDKSNRITDIEKE